ncbi:MAG TPA: chromosomal replication initiator protein DnaA [Phycisphaerae bacterium]|nr:chromosomal replication initiator protein DnaA [Phycisphaerae bacterium]
MATLDVAAHAQAVWKEVLEYLAKLHSSWVRQWFGELVPVELAAGTLTVRAATVIQQQYLMGKCRDVFTEAAQAVTGNLVSVNFITGANAGGGLARLGDSYDDVILSPDYVFENFVTGPCNRLAGAACSAVAEKPGRAYNPLFIHGGCGLGKTHLLQATCQEILRRTPEARILYLSCDTFINHFMDCVQNGDMNEFRFRYRHVDVLVIDDIHFLTRRDRTQEEFFHTFNTLFQGGKQIILSSDAPPNEIPDLEDRLVSRFNSGLVARVDRPCYETRIAIVSKKARLRGITLPEEVIAYIARRVESNTRELEGAITKIQGYAMLNGGTYDMDVARAALGDVIPPSERLVSIQQIIDAVTRFYNVRLADLQSKKRHKSIALPRQVCMYIARQKTRYSLEEIGGYFGGRDHTTVMHAIRTVSDNRQSDEQFAAQLERIETMLLPASTSLPNAQSA